MAIWGDPVDLIGGELDDFELLGRGGTATVYRAVDRSLGRHVAVKVLRGDAHPAGAGRVPEARAQAAVSWHANVLSLYGTGHLLDGSPCLVLEYAPGGSLQDRVASSGPLPAEEVMSIGAQLADALAAAHDAGLVHCDVKPSNVLFAADGSVRLSDFGIARSSDAETATLDQLAGSLAYVPPELLDGARPKPSNDVYSLAATLWFALAGRPPFGADDQPAAAVLARVRDEHMSFARLSELLPGANVEILDRALSKDPVERPSADQLAATLRHGTTAPGARPAGAPGDPVRSRHRVAVGAALLLVVALVASVMVVGQWSRASEDEARPVDLCRTFRQVLTQRLDLFNDISADLEQSGSPVDVVERLLVTYPVEFGALVGPFLADVATLNPRVEQVTGAQLAQMTRADVLRGLSGGREFLYDGESGVSDATALTGELREPAEAFSSANAFASRRCPAVRTDLAAGKARMYSAIYSSLSNPVFMRDFFSDPRSYDLLDTSNVLLMLAVARNFFEGLLGDQWPWFFDMLTRTPETRTAVARLYPDFILAGAAHTPSLQEVIGAEPWRADLAAGLAQMGPSQRAGVRQLYGAELMAAGIELP
jgi:hypothetical protein